MPEIPLPKGITGLSDFPKFQEYLTNLFYTETGFIRSPGIEEFGTGVDVCRGVARWVFDGVAYMVSGQSLLSIDINGETTVIGIIDGDEDCLFSQGQANLVIVVKRGNGYKYNLTDGLLQITDPNYKPSVSVDFIDGRHVFVPADGSPAFYSNVDDAGTIEPLSFFDAEEIPDKNRADINIANQLYIAGSDSTEIFRTNIDPDVVFSRREGGRIDVGAISDLARYANTFAFIGRRREKGPKIYLMGSGDAQEISNDAVNEIIGAYPLDELEAAEPFVYEHYGMEVLCFTLGNHTLSFFQGNWFYQSSGLTLRNWRVKGICNAYGKWIVGDRDSARIGILSCVSSEYGEKIEAELSTFIRSSRDANIQIAKIEADMMTGRKSPAETVGLKLSSDGKTYGQTLYKSLGELGDYQRRIVWQPIGKMESFLGVKIRTTTDAKIALDFLTSQ